MVEHLDEVKTEFEKILQVIKKDRSLLEYYLGAKGLIKKINVENIANIACNHLFDDFPELFGITKLEGHKIREYFHNCNPYDFTSQLHNAFPDFFEEETPEYLEHVRGFQRVKRAC